MKPEQMDRLKEKLVKLTNYKREQEEKKKELVGALTYELKQTNKRIEVIAEALKEKSFECFEYSKAFDEIELEYFMNGK